MVTLSENKKLLKERLGEIMSYKKKSKYIAIITALVAVVMTSGFIVAGAYVNNASNFSTSKKQTAEDEIVLEKSGMSLIDSFGKYGFTYNSKENAVYYKGKRVKQFVDGGAYYNGGGFWCDFYYSDKANQGTLYLHVVRDSHGSIQDIEAMTSDMIQKLYNQDKVLNIKPNQNNLSTEESYKAFSQYGLTYDKINDIVLYNGEPVKAFVDGGSKYSKGGYWFNITFFNDTISSSLYLTSKRDENGKIIGIENMSQQMIEDYYGLNGILAPLENEQAVVDFSTDLQSIFTSFELPELPAKIADSGNYHFYDNQNSRVLAVTRWEDITGTFSLCDIFNTKLNSTVTIGYEITVGKGYFDFIHTNTNSGVTNIIINENVNSNKNAAYDYGVLELDIPNGNNNFSFKCNNANVDIRIVAMY